MQLELSETALVTISFLVVVWLGIKNPAARNWLLKMFKQNKSI